MAKVVKTSAPQRAQPVVKRTSIGSGRPLNKHKRRTWKRYRGQGRV